MVKHKKNSILRNKLGRKHNLLMKFGQFMSYYKRRKFMKKFYKNCDLKTSPRFACVRKELGTTSIGKWNLLRQAIYIRFVIAKLSEFTKSACMASKIPFTEDIFKTNK